MRNKMKKLLAVVVILLFFVVAFAQSINANVSKPDLDTSVEDDATPIDIELQRIRELIQTIDLQLCT